MKIVIAIDSFKGSLTSLEAGKIVAEGIKKVDAKTEVVVRPLADGGEGTVEALTLGMGGEFHTVEVTGPLGSKVKCTYGIIEESKTAIIEMAEAAGLPLVPLEERNPLDTTTFGVGEVIKDAINQGCRRFIIGIGGSATNDGGIGMLQALGYGMLNQDGQQISHGAKGLAELVNITEGDVIPELKQCTFHIACDVTNPLCGSKGSSAIYGPQKGATDEQILQMDQWLEQYGKLAKEKGYSSDINYPGSGAAGGMGFAFLTFLNGTLKSGIDLILKETKLEEGVKDADIIVTGEGRLDAQTVMGKAPIGVAKIGKKYDKAVIAFSGCATRDAVVCNEAGIDAFFPILREPQSVEEAMEKEEARKNLRDASEQVFRLIDTFHK